jgi:hypothetical protein
MNLPSKESFIFLHIWKNSLPLPINFSPKSNNILIINFIRNYTHTLYTDVNVHVGGRHGRDRIVVGFTTPCAISAYHH